MRNNLSPILPPDGFLFCSFSVVGRGQLAGEDSSFVAAVDDLASLCTADDFDGAALSEDLCFTAAPDDLPWSCNSAGAWLLTTLDNSSLQDISRDPSVLPASVNCGTVDVLTEMSVAAELESLSISCSSLGGRAAADLEDFSSLDMVDRPSSFLDPIDDDDVADLERFSPPDMLDGSP